MIYKFLSHTISESEKRELQKWIEDKDNYNTFKQYIEDNFALSSMLNSINDEDAYAKVLTKINDTPVYKLKPWYKRDILKYVALLVLFVSVGYFVLNSKNKTVEQSEPIIVNNKIETIKSKAILTLEDGSTVALGKGETYSSKNLSAQDEQLVYRKSGESKKELVFNSLTVPRGGEFYVILSDGTEVWLNSESQIKYPENFVDGQTREVELAYGEAYFKVSPSVNHNGAKFKVLHATNEEVEVLGTEFNIKAYNDESSTYTTLVEGSIALKVNGEKRLLVPSQQAIYNSDNKQLEVKKVDVFDEISWRNNIYSFKSKPLKDIMNVLSRWYDMDVVFQEESIKETKFVGVLDKKQDIVELVGNLKDLGFINAYEIHNKTLILK